MKKLISIVLISGLALTLTGCEDRKCLDGYTTFTPIIISNGNGGITTSILPMFHCTKYEEKNDNTNF